MLLLAVGAGALVATSQLGLAYGLGVVRLTRVFGTTMRDHWPAQLAWAAWFAMVAAAAGAWLAGRVARRHGEASRPALHGALAAAAGLGAVTVVPLVMQPARTAQVIGVDPVVVIGISAGLGALAGAIAGYAALASWTARLSLLSVGGAVWLVALVSVVPSLGGSDELPAARLGVLDATFLSPTATQRFALFTMPAIALVSGAALGWVARRRGSPTLTIASAGLAGPALLTAAYLIAGPGDGGERYQSVPYWAAMIATAAGALGSVLAAVIRRQEDDADDAERDDAQAADRPGSAPADTTAVASGSPATGSPAFGSPAFGSPAFGSPAFGGPLTGGPLAGSAATVGSGTGEHGAGRPGEDTRPTTGDPELTALFARHRDPQPTAFPPGASPTGASPTGASPPGASPATEPGTDPAARPGVPTSGNAPHPPEPGPARMSTLRRRGTAGAEAGPDRPANPGGLPGQNPGGLPAQNPGGLPGHGPETAPGRADREPGFFTHRPTDDRGRWPEPTPDDPFRPGPPVGGGLGRGLPQPRPAAGPRIPQPVQRPPVAPPAGPPTAAPGHPTAAPGRPHAADPVTGQPPTGRGPVPQPRPGEAPPTFAARPVGEQPFGGVPSFSAFGRPADDAPDRPRTDGTRKDGPRDEVPQRDADYVDWVSGLGDR